MDVYLTPVQYEAEISHETGRHFGRGRNVFINGARY